MSFWIVPPGTVWHEIEILKTMMKDVRVGNEEFTPVDDKEFSFALTLYHSLPETDAEHIKKAAEFGQYTPKGERTMNEEEFEEWLEEHGLVCKYTKIKGTWKSGQGMMLSVDRVINFSEDDQGNKRRHLHTKQNCVVSLSVINIAIKHYPKEQLEAWVKRIKEQ